MTWRPPNYSPQFNSTFSIYHSAYDISYINKLFPRPQIYIQVRGTQLIPIPPEDRVPTTLLQVNDQRHTEASGFLYKYLINFVGTKKDKTIAALETEVRSDESRLAVMASLSSSVLLMLSSLWWNKQAVLLMLSSLVVLQWVYTTGVL